MISRAPEKRGGAILPQEAPSTLGPRCGDARIAVGIGCCGSASNAIIIKKTFQN